MCAENWIENTLCCWRSVRQATDAVSTWVSRVLVLMALSVERVLHRLQVYCTAFAIIYVVAITITSIH